MVSTGDGLLDSEITSGLMIRGLGFRIFSNYRAGIIQFALS